MARQVGSHFQAPEKYEVSTLQRPTDVGFWSSSALGFKALTSNDIHKLNYTQVYGGRSGRKPRL